MEFVRGHEEDFERLPALCINLSAERVGIEYQDENLSSCELDFRNLSSHLVVRLSRTKDSSFYFGVESVRVPDFSKSFTVLNVTHRNKIIETVTSRNALTSRVKESVLSHLASLSLSLHCRQGLGVANALIDVLESWQEIRLWLGHYTDRVASMTSFRSSTAHELVELKEKTDRLLGFSMKSYDVTSRVSRFCLKTLSELFVHRQIGLEREKFKKENDTLKQELEISKRRVEKLEKEISRVRSAAEIEVQQLKDNSNREIRKWKDLARTIVPKESEEITKLKKENARLSALVSRLSRAVHGLCTS